MGSAVAAAGVGLAAKNLLDSNSDYKRQKKDIRREQQQSLTHRKNLLEEQLASRRARIGAMGLNSTGSSTRYQERLINQSMREAEIDDQEYRSQLSGLSVSRKRGVRDSLLNVAGSVASSKK